MESKDLVLDTSKLEVLRSIDTSGEDVLLKKVYSLFRDSFGPSLNEIKNKLNSSQFKDISHLAHKLKSGSGSLGANRLYLVLSELEGLSLAGDKGVITPLIESLEGEFLVFCKAIELELK